MEIFRRAKTSYKELEELESFIGFKVTEVNENLTARWVYIKFYPEDIFSTLHGWARGTGFFDDAKVGDKYAVTMTKVVQE